jgi:uncharacterized protein involved in exopolysaccharide biosynthesis
MNTNKSYKPEPSDNEVDFGELVSKIWNARKFIAKACAVAVVVGLVVAFSIPKEYTTAVTMAPEEGTKKGSGNLGSLASLAGINLAGGTQSEALSPDLYPDIVRSTPFMLDLFPVQVRTMENETFRFYDFMLSHQRYPWWSILTGAPFKAIGWVTSLFKETKSIGKESKIDPFMLTEEHATVIEAVKGSILVAVDEQSGVISLKVTMQDPMVSAMITDTVMKNLQIYITNYRTNKAKQDLEYTEKLYKEAKSDYYVAQQRYADFADSNRDIILTGFRTKQERLQSTGSNTYLYGNSTGQCTAQSV